MFIDNNPDFSAVVIHAENVEQLVINTPPVQAENENDNDGIDNVIHMEDFFLQKQKENGARPIYE